MIRYRTTLGILCQIVMAFYLIITSCSQPSDQEESLAGYYFPVNQLPPGGMVYTYQNKIDTAADPEVWKHTKMSDGLLESINYDYRGEVVQKQYDRMVTNGVVTDSLILFFEDSLGKKLQRKVHIIIPHRFPFEPGDSNKVWLTHMEWWQPGDSLHIVLQRRRKFLEYTTWKSDGKSIPAVRFKTEDTFESELDGWTTSTWTGEELYAQHIGLVYYRRNISDQLKIEFELKNRK